MWVRHLSAVLYAVGTRELAIAEVDVVDELLANEATGALAIVRVGIGAIATTRAIHGVVRLTCRQLSAHRSIDRFSVRPGKEAFRARLRRRGRPLGITVWAAHPTAEIGGEADARFALIRAALDVHFLLVEACKVLAILVFGNTWVTDAAAFATHGRKTECCNEDGEAVRYPCLHFDP